MVLSLFSVEAFAQTDEKDEKIMADSEDAKAAFLKDDLGMMEFFENSYGYSVPGMALYYRVSYLNGESKSRGGHLTGTP